jgi:glycosyltransferase involved in cell wall biosynthesis
VLTVSLSFQRDLTRIGIAPRRITVVPNAINPAWGRGTPTEKDALRRELGLDSKRKIILSVGRLSKEKDHVTLIRAFARMQISNGAPPAYLVMVGDGPERHKLEALVRDLRVASVIFTGQTASAEPFYGIADLVVLSSLTEGAPNTLLEAMAAGVPAVATAVGGVPEIAKDGYTALLLKPRDTDAMAVAMNTVLTNPQLAARLVANATRTIVERHSPEYRAGRLCDFYGALVQSPR